MTVEDLAGSEAPFTLLRKTAIVTGGGRGIGRAIVQSLAFAGANILASDLDDEALKETQSLVRHPNLVASIRGDLTDSSFPKQIVDVALEKFHSIDIIFNCAGFSWDSVIQKTSDEQFQAMLDIHVVAPFRLLRPASNYFRENAQKEIAAGLCVIAQGREHHLDLRYRRECRSGRIRRRSHWTYENSC